MLRIVLNNMKPQPEKIIAEELAGFRAGRSTTEQILNLRILFDKHLQHQHDLYYVFIDFKKAFYRDWHIALRAIDFKKAFDMIWHIALWATVKKYNINANLIRVIKHLYYKAISATLFNSSIGDWFRTTVGVRQG